MSVVTAVMMGLAMGLVFGLALEKSRVFEPGVILGQMQLRSFIMLKVFLSAVVTGLAVVGVLYGFGFSSLYPKPTLWGADVVGGLILGAGITLAGACPGTVLAQIGAGYRDAWVTLIGAFAGAATFIAVEPMLKPLLLSGGPGKLTLDQVLGLPFWQVAAILAVVLVMALVALEWGRPWRSDLGPEGDGVTAAEGSNH